MDGFLEQIGSGQFAELREYMENVEPQGYPAEERRFAWLACLSPRAKRTATPAAFHHQPHIPESKPGKGIIVRLSDLVKGRRR